MPKQGRMRAIGVTSAPASPLTAIAPPQDTKSTAPHLAVAAAPTATIATVQDIQEICYGLSSRAWLRAWLLPIEAASCRSSEDWLALVQRHFAAGVQDLAAGAKEIAAIGASLPPTPRR